MSNGAEKIIYTMMKVGKMYQGRPVIRIYPVLFLRREDRGLGSQRFGEKTLLRIMAGVDHEYEGHAVLSPGYTVGYLEQEPVLDPAMTVRQAVEEGLKEAVDLVNEYNEISLKFAESLSDDEMDALMARQGELQEKIDHLDAWDIDSRLEMAMDALRCPRRTR